MARLIIWHTIGIYYVK
jgi:tetratricopeptide (TPR) repeat protein